MSAGNIRVSDRSLISGSICRVIKHLARRLKPFCSTIHVKFDDPKTGNSLEDRRLCAKLKEFVPVIARAKRFPFKKGESFVIADRKQFLLILGHVVTVHKSQGSDVAYMQCDLTRFTSKNIGKNYQQAISQGQFYTLLSFVKSCDKVLLLNFEPEDSVTSRRNLETTFSVGGLVFYPHYQQNFIDYFAHF